MASSPSAPAVPPVGIQPETSLGSSTLRSMSSKTFDVNKYTLPKLYKHFLANPLLHGTAGSAVAGEVHGHGDENEEEEGPHSAQQDTARSSHSSSTATSFTGTLSKALSAGGQIERLKKKAMQEIERRKDDQDEEGLRHAETLCLAEIIKVCAELHGTHAATLEQVLLLVDHLISKSFLCKFVLMETGLPLVLQRYLQSRPPQLYLVALAQLCLENIEV